MTAKKKTIFIIGIEFHFSREPRIIQEIYALRGHYHLVGAGRGPHPDLDEFIDITKDRSSLDVFLDKILRYAKYFFPFLLRFRHRKILKRIDELKPDCISAHHLESAILAYAKTDKMLFNSHEFIPKQNDGILIWKYTKGWMIKTTLPKTLRHTAVMYVEGEAAKEAYMDYYKSIPETVVVPNATKAWPELSPVQVDPSHIKLVHHGNATVGRGLETFVDVARILGSGYSLHFYLVQSVIFPGYYEHLKLYAKDVPNVFFYDAVPYDDIVPTMNQYDIGLCLYKSTHFHTKYTMVPNKFWEYIAGRVSPVIWRESGITRICEEYGFGVIAEEPTVDEIVRVIREQSAERIMADKQRMDEIHNEFIAEKTIYPVMLDCVKRTIALSKS
jgi:hypothetical protein